MEAIFINKDICYLINISIAPCSDPSQRPGAKVSVWASPQHSHRPRSEAIVWQPQRCPWVWSSVAVSFWDCPCPPVLLRSESTSAPLPWSRCGQQGEAETPHLHPWHQPWPLQLTVAGRSTGKEKIQLQRQRQRRMKSREKKKDQMVLRRNHTLPFTHTNAICFTVRSWRDSDSVQPTGQRDLEFTVLAVQVMLR